MTSSQHQHWIDLGEHWVLAVPLIDLKAAIVEVWNPPAETIGTIGDAAHLDAQPPEDHTPYSETGWPAKTPYGVVTALDYSGPGWEALFDHLINERMAGRMLWIKYINYKGIHHRWEPNYTSGMSSDDPRHGHLSILSSWCYQSTGLTPAQLTGIEPLPQPEPTPAPVGADITEAIMSGWHTLVPGSTGQQVKDAQALVNAHGAGLLVDGLYGPKTTGAVQLFQVEHEVANSVRADGTGDGQVGPRTIMALLDL